MKTKMLLALLISSNVFILQSAQSKPKPSSGQRPTTKQIQINELKQQINELKQMIKDIKETNAEDLADSEEFADSLRDIEEDPLKKINIIASDSNLSRFNKNDRVIQALLNKYKIAEFEKFLEATNSDDFSYLKDGMLEKYALDKYLGDLASNIVGIEGTKFNLTEYIRKGKEAEKEIAQANEAEKTKQKNIAEVARTSQERFSKGIDLGDLEDDAKNPRASEAAKTKAAKALIDYENAVKAHEAALAKQAADKQKAAEAKREAEAKRAAEAERLAGERVAEAKRAAEAERAAGERVADLFK